jgi:HEAT repeat protein
VELTKAALLDALRNADPKVRWLATAKLAQDKVSEAIPALLEALRAERLSSTRVNIALSVALPGHSDGFSALQDGCVDLTADIWVRLQAARYLLDFLKRPDLACRNALLAVVRAQPSPDSMAEAVSLLRRARGLSREESEEILTVALKALADPEPAQKLAASKILVEPGDRSAMTYLRAAIDREQDETVRTSMQADLKQVGKKEK